MIKVLLRHICRSAPGFSLCWRCRCVGYTQTTPFYGYHYSIFPAGCQGGSGARGEIFSFRNERIGGRQYPVPGGQTAQAERLFCGKNCEQSGFIWIWESDWKKKSGAVLKLNAGFSAASFSFPEGEARGVPPLHTKKSGQELCRHVQSSLALTEKPAPGGGNAALCRSGCLYNA